MTTAKKDSKKHGDYTILIVDHDTETRQIAAEILLKEGFQVLFANPFEEAKEVLDQQDIDLILTEMVIPGESGVEFLKWVRRIYDRKPENSGPLPFVILTENEDILDDHQLDNYQNHGCIFKPANEHVLMERVKTNLQLYSIEDRESGGLGYENLENSPNLYCKILLSDFISQKVLQFDLFINLNKTKFVRVAKKGEPVNEVQFKRYFEKGVKYIYAKKMDFKTFVDYTLKVNHAVVKSDSLGLKRKKQFMVKTNEVILESVYVRGFQKETFNEANNFICSSINTLMQDKTTFDLLDALNQHDDHLYAHCLGVSLYSVMIAQFMGWHSGTNLYKLSIGGLLHDIGKMHLPREIVDKPKSDLTFSEKALLETHPERGRDILIKVKTVPSDVVAIAYEHHENSSGQGYPRMLSKTRITPMARIVNLADEFCQLAIKNPNTEGHDAATALTMLDQYKHNQLDSDALRALRSLIREQKSNAA